MTKSVTDGGGTTHFYGVFNGTCIIGKAMGVFVPGPGSTGLAAQAE